MKMNRRVFASAAGVAIAGTAGFAMSRRNDVERSLARLKTATADWDDVRALFPLSHEYVDLTAMLLTSHPAPVADAIERYRCELDQNPTHTIQENNRGLQNEARDAAGDYFGIAGENVALTDSTTMGVGLVYAGLKLRPSMDVLTTDQDYYVTHEALRLAAERTGATVRRVPLFEKIATVSTDEMVANILAGLRPETRVVALTWVHSSTGLKIPVRQIADALAEVNEKRPKEKRILLCVDGVHGFGNQDTSLPELGCDFLMAGCHKWIFGPRGTGIVMGTARGWESVIPTIPSFLDPDAYGRWKRDEPTVTTTASMFTPGGFQPFEHLWALKEAFALHQLIGRGCIARRTAELASQLKEGLLGIAGVTLQTPVSPQLSAGIVSFDVDGMTPAEVVAKLRDYHVIGSVAPYRVPHVRLTPSIRNSETEIETTLRAIRKIAG